MQLPALSDAKRIELFERRPSVTDIILDTDTYNEIDDQFAVVYALLASDSIHVSAICAAPFQNGRSTSAGDGMEKSYAEIRRLIERLPGSGGTPVARGATRFMQEPDRPVASEAVDAIAAAASSHSAENPLYLVAIGAPTNVSSALVLHPEMVDRVVVVWLGGHAPWWPDTAEFNYRQDLGATHVLFDSGVALVQIPCMGVASHLITTPAEIDFFVKGRGEIGEYLCRIYRDFHSGRTAASKVIWDISTIGYLRNPSWTRSTYEHSPIVNPNMTYSSDPTRHLIRRVFELNRDEIFNDLYALLAK